MAACGDALIACDSSSSSQSGSNSPRFPAAAVAAASPGQPKVAWGGAGLVPLVAMEKKRGKSSSCWGPSSKTSSKASFRDLQSEDLAKELSSPKKPALNMTQDELELIMKTLSESSASEVAGGSSSAAAAVEDSTDNDFALARTLQYEYDLEHDMKIELNQRHTNKNSKLSISYNHYKILPSFASEGRDPPPQDDEPLDEIEAGELDEPSIPPCGYVQHEGVMVTKHDSTITARKNAKKLLHMLPLEVNTGDAGGFTINMPNKVFNNLNASMHSEGKRKQRVHDKVEKVTMGSHMDQTTSLGLWSMVNCGVLEDVGGIISTGKEALVYHATGGSLHERKLPKHCVVKVFKTKLAEFKTRERYIRDDHRFKDRMTKTNNYTNMKLWVEKEYRNLCRVHTANVPCPEPFHVKGNLLVMGLLGDPDLPSPQLRNVQLSSANWELAYQQTVQILRDLTYKCRLVHADLSEYNLLYDEGDVFVIDFAQAVDITHPSALSYLYRDCCNISNFFHRRGVARVLTGLELLEDITKLDIRSCSGQDHTDQVAKAEHELDMWRSSDCYDDAMYEFLWNAAQMRQQMMNSMDLSEDDLPEELANLSLDKSGSSFKEQWITKKTDGAITKPQKKKKKTRKNSGSKTEKPDESLCVSVSENEVSGFCLVDTVDCIKLDSPVDQRQEDSLVGQRLDSLVGQRLGQRVRFDVDDTDAADTEDYNADADTDDLDADTDDIDTDANANDEDTEGYHADGDDTDNNASSDGGRLKNYHHDVRAREASSTSKGAARSDVDDSSDQQHVSTPVSRSAKTTHTDKRNTKKKNKKPKGKSGCN